MHPPTRHRRHRSDPTDTTDPPAVARTPSRLGAVLLVAVPVVVTATAASPEFVAGAATTALVVAANALLR